MVTIRLQAHMYKYTELVKQVGWKGVKKIVYQGLQEAGKLVGYIQVRPGFLETGGREKSRVTRGAFTQHIIATNLIVV